jgi:hypothetical protein
MIVEIVPLWVVLVFLFMLVAAVINVAKPLLHLVAALVVAVVVIPSLVFLSVWTALNNIGSRLGFYIPSRTMGERGVVKGPANPHGRAGIPG